MKISVIVPIYNAEEHLHKSIDSILNQSYENIELILINDGSTDRSLEICREYKDKDDRVTIINSKNKGPGVARNRGIQRASGEYLTFVDADDALREDALYIMVLLAKEKDYTVISSNHYLVKDDIKVGRNYPRTGEITREESGEARKRYHKFKESSSFGYVWAKLYKTSFIKNKNIKFTKDKEVFLEDRLFNLKVFAYKPKYYALNEPLYYYSVYDDSLSNKKEDIRDRALKMLEDYERFLIQKDKYGDNLDLFVPLNTKVISWSVLKALENKFSLKTAFRTIGLFSQSATMKRLLARKGNFREIWKIRRPLESILYSLMLVLMKYKLEAVLAFLFVIGYPLSKVYVKRVVKS